MIIINSNTRYFNVPGSDLVFGVVADSDAERKHFQCPRYVGDGLDLAACFIRINYRNANGKEDFYLVDDVAIDGDNITFSWLLSPKVTEYRGQVKFVVCAVGPDLKLKWHTTQGTGQVMEGLEPDNSHVESQTADVVAQLIAMVEEQTSAVEKVGTGQVAAVNSAAKTAQDGAVTAIETAGAAVKASIPTDYTALNDAMRKVAPGIVCSAEGEVITMNDASDNGFRGLRIFGKSTQDGTPTPENPVEIVSVENPVVTVAGKNLLKNTAKTTSLNGCTVTVNTDKTITLNGNCTANFSIKIGTLSYIGTVIMSDGVTSEETNKSYIISVKDGQTYVSLSGGETTFTNTTVDLLFELVIMAGTYNNVTIKPMIRLASVKDATYEPPNEQVMSIAAPNGLPGIPVTSGGNYTDANGQQWICDEVDFERGVYVQRIGWKQYNNATSWGAAFDIGDRVFNDRFRVALDEVPLSSVGVSNMHSIIEMWGISDGSIGFNGSDNYVYARFTGIASKESLGELFSIKPLVIAYIKTTHIETPLSETELAAYRALHTNKPNTTILNDSGAYMSVDYTADTKLYIDNKIKEALL